jgi:transcriptional regulator with PAS, ATPase and Fis domain
MYVEEIKIIENELKEIIENIQLKTIKLYRTTENMSDLILKEITFSLDDLSIILSDTNHRAMSYSRTCKMLEDLTSYMENRMFDHYTDSIDTKLLSKDIKEIIKLCMLAEEKFKKINEENIYEEEMYFLSRYRTYLSILSYFLVV